MRLILILLTVLGLSACAPPAPAQADLGDVVDDYLTNQVDGGFSGAVLVAVGGEVVLSKGYGLADREAGAANTPQTVFQIGSVAKPFTATAILKLRDEGRLDVTDLIAGYFTEVPADKQDMTLHHLLTHTSGFPGEIGADFEVIDRKAYITRALETPLNREPGTGYEYSNVGFALLAAIIEQVTGQSYDDYLQDAVLGPAGIQHTGYRLPDGLPRARGYDGDRDLGLPTDRAWAPDGPYWNLRGNGGLLSTAEDLYRFHQALEAGEILSEESLALAYTAHTDEGPGSGTHYGYGWALFPAPGGRLVTHNGGDPGFSADVLRFVDDDKVLIVLSNDRRVEAFDVSGPLSRLLFGQDAEPVRRPGPAGLTLDALASSPEGQRALAFVEAVNTATEDAYRAFTEAHLDAMFRQNPDGVLRFFGAVADEIGHAPMSLQRAEWADAERLHLFATLADGRGYWIELGFDDSAERRIAGMQTDYVEVETVRAGAQEADASSTAPSTPTPTVSPPEGVVFPDTPAGRTVERLVTVLGQSDEAARRAFAASGFAARLREGRSEEDLLGVLDRMAGDLDSGIASVVARGQDRVVLVTPDGLQLVVQVEPRPPHGILGVEAER